MSGGSPAAWVSRRLKGLWEGLKETVWELSEDMPFQLAGALSYFTLLSLAPLLLLIVAGAGILFGEEAVRNQISAEIGRLVGEEGAEAVKLVMARAAAPEAGAARMLIGFGALFIGATTVFVQLQTALNTIWRVRVAPTTSTVWSLVRSRLLSLAMVLVLGFLLLVSLVTSAGLNALDQHLREVFPDQVTLWRSLNTGASLGIAVLFVGLIFKFLPDVRVSWRDVGVGAAVTGVLLGVGRTLIGLYLSQAGLESTYGAAGSVVVFMVWIYYASLIFFFGAKVTLVYARRRGERIAPSPHAVPIHDHEMEGPPKPANC